MTIRVAWQEEVEVPLERVDELQGSVRIAAQGIGHRRVEILSKEQNHQHMLRTEYNNRVM